MPDALTPEEIAALRLLAARAATLDRLIQEREAAGMFWRLLLAVIAAAGALSLIWGTWHGTGR